ncbi:nucleotide exchange factor GrpE [Lysinibacillus sp. 3P01SB]|uniref:nucleotide exchange factor GrpE n=1 Tax=Lysinibacillus sp. 3P01SB TaxID=3132284 RepID=UPI0039A51B2A
MSNSTDNNETKEELKQQASAEEAVEAAEQPMENVEEAAEETAVDEKEQKIAELTAKLEEEENRYLRLRADYDNILRRHKLERESAEKFRAQSLLTDLLPVLDNLERALQVEVTSDDANSLYKGVEMVYRQFLDAAGREGLEAIAAEGEAFDPNVHQAVMQEQDAEKESGIVLRELQKGYKLKDRVLRPAMVSVNE